MRTGIAVLALALAAAAFTGCARTRATVVKVYPPQPANHPIEIITSPPTDRKYEEIALLDAKGGQFIWSDRSSGGMVVEVQEKAREADAVAIRYLNAPAEAPKPDPTAPEDPSSGR